MDVLYFSAFAALAGSAIGGLTTLAASWLMQRLQFRAQRLAHNIDRREDLYKDFIEEASKSYTDAFHHDIADVSKLFRLYALVSRMRVLSSQGVIEEADKVMRSIVERYLGPNMSAQDLQDVVINGGTGLDPLRDFSNACRDEFESGVGRSWKWTRTGGRV
jgi:hypothetical protein